MPCPVCGATSKVYQTTLIEQPKPIRCSRRRKCVNFHTFYTKESVDRVALNQRNRDDTVSELLTEGVLDGEAALRPDSV